jgi:hypothetical protein
MGREQILYFVEEKKSVVAGASAVGRRGERHIHSKFPNQREACVTAGKRMSV